MKYKGECTVSKWKTFTETCKWYQLEKVNSYYLKNFNLGKIINKKKHKHSCCSSYETPMLANIQVINL